ncbi:hypothetical protein BDFB_000805 [Asbolus verrucosus]|uniref:Uncharacterized protein n=1 Tax=Asbolus verrucosus TaxID=1661398 RepID=A0A482WD71_ASBVE|nr:hypothetical protein BDFB_000805 [Asbolus verrucosus]
MPLSLEGRLIS